MQIITQLLTSLPQDKVTLFSKEIAKWHYQEWGKYKPGTSESDWLSSFTRSLQAGTQVIIATRGNQLLGSLSLKQQNMDNMFPKLSPWVSGLYVVKEFRKQKVSAMLLKAVAELAQQQGVDYLYAFSHHLAFERLVKKFGWTALSLPGIAKPHYKNAPVILLQAKVACILDSVEKFPLQAT